MKKSNAWWGVRPFERHSLVLLVAGAIYVCIGISYLIAEPTPARVEALKYATRLFDYNEWGWSFVLVGSMSLISARWPPVSEKWGYFALTGQTSAWAAFYLSGVVFGGTPLSNISAFMSWGLIAFMWWGISGLVNPKAAGQMLSENQRLMDEVLRLRYQLETSRSNEIEGG